MKKQIKKPTAMLMSAMMVIGLVSGCGSSGNDPAQTPEQPGSSAQSQSGSESTGSGSEGSGSGQEVVLTYISSTILESPEGDFEQKVIDEFNALDNGITIKVEGVASNDLMKKYITLATSNSMPDLFMVNQNDAATIIDMGLAADVTEVFGAEYLAGFVGDNLTSYTVDGKLMGIPWFGGAQGVLYRKDIFDQKGLEVPETWEELVSVSQQLTGDGDYGITLVGTKNSSGSSRFQSVIRNFGVDEFYQDAEGKWQTDIGSEKYIKALKEFTDLDIEYGTVPPGVIETGYPEAVSLFSSGKAAMLITGSNAIGAITSQVPELKGKLGSFPIPAVERSVSTVGGFGIFISPGEHQEAAGEFIKFLLETDTALEFSQMTGRLPTRTEAIESPAIAEMPELEGFIKALENIYVVPAIPGYNEVSDIHGEAYQGVFTGTMSVESAAAKAQQRAQQICDTANSQ